MTIREGYLLKDRIEKFNGRRVWFVNAWRIVDKNGKDIIQPWCSTKAEAMSTAKMCNIVIKETSESSNVCN